MRWFHRYFTYIALAIFLFAIYRFDYFVVPRIHSVALFAGSFVFLFTGCLVNVLSFRQILAKYGCKVGYATCLSASGLTVFSKYIPGKIWAILSKAAYISEKAGYSIGSLSSISMNAQFISLWLGLSLGGAGLIFVGKVNVPVSLIVVLWCGLSIIIFSKILYNLIEKAVKRLLGRSIVIPRLHLVSTLHVMPLVFLWWGLWAAGFYLMVESITDVQMPFYIGLGFPLAAALSIMAVIAPGGMGVREGVLAGYLVLAGLNPEMGVTASIVSRLWFFIGEIFLFMMGMIAHRWIAGETHVRDVQLGSERFQ